MRSRKIMSKKEMLKSVKTILLFLLEKSTKEIKISVIDFYFPFFMIIIIFFFYSIIFE